jgi:hypothetical protein
MIMKITACFILALGSAVANIPADSPFAKRLLSKARLLNNQNDDGSSFTWVNNYSVKFHSCHTTLNFRADGGGGEGGDSAPTESLRLVHFQLCPTDACAKSCKNGADYIVEMREFVESYLEFQMNQKEYNCEKVKDACYCDNYNDDDVCLSDCYAAASLNYCENQNNNNGNNGNDMGKLLECEALNENNNNNNNGGSSSVTYVGAYCSSDGKGIYLGTFSDNQCSKKSDVSAYKTYTGYDLPYTTESMVQNDCISCMEASQYDDDQNQDKNDADQVREICEDLYDRSAKCESGISTTVNPYRTTGGCEYIFNTLPQAEKLATGKRTGSPATAFAWLFACTTVAATGYAVLLWQKLNRSKVDLSSGGAMA